jgi:hypothetical protein
MIYKSFVGADKIENYQHYGYKSQQFVYTDFLITGSGMYTIYATLHPELSMSNFNPNNPNFISKAMYNKIATQYEMNELFTNPIISDIVLPPNDSSIVGYRMISLSHDVIGDGIKPESIRLTINVSGSGLEPYDGGVIHLFDDGNNNIYTMDAFKILYESDFYNSVSEWIPLDKQKSSISLDSNNGALRLNVNATGSTNQGLKIPDEFIANLNTSSSMILSFECMATGDFVGKQINSNIGSPVLLSGMTTASLDNMWQRNVYYFNSGSAAYSFNLNFSGSTINNGTFSIKDVTMYYANGTASADSIYVGNVSYESGMICLYDKVGQIPYGDYFDKYNSIVDFKSTVLCSENNYIINIHPGEFNKSNNPTSATFDNETGISDDTFNNEYPTFISCIGLYNDVNELLAIAKVPYPLEKSKKFHTTFVVKLNY